MSTLPSYDIFFTGPSDDPRHNCVMIGFLDDTARRPFYLAFETPEIPTSETVTTVYRDNRRLVASFEWSAKNYMGMATIAGRKTPMVNLVLPGTSSSARKFMTTDGRAFEWRKAATFPSGFRYDLHSGPNIASIATFSRFSQPQITDVGPSYACLNCRFDDELLLIEASLALCLNRWIDQRC
ncbi:hypothetical protein BDY19DRAFT_337229 [Irpex rosettiformis]|uniref:Uncharacterized protein n=1 Tax=Irpex rosettiformis TaxID=378272 RepID=A0ACB8TX19_9APHY|nr:hypothetical protein BDY19DRAFT_337229 [Irpex rosettiformis]